MFYFVYCTIPHWWPRSAGSARTYRTQNYACLARQSESETRKGSHSPAVSALAFSRDLVWLHTNFSAIRKWTRWDFARRNFTFLGVLLSVSRVVRLKLLFYRWMRCLWSGCWGFPACDARRCLLLWTLPRLRLHVGSRIIQFLHEVGKFYSN